MNQNPKQKSQPPISNTRRVATAATSSTSARKASVRGRPALKPGSARIRAVSMTTTIDYLTASRRRYRRIAERLPSVASTKGQMFLVRKHGTPKEFAAAAADQIGEISVNEWEAVVNKYLEEWDEA